MDSNYVILKLTSDSESNNHPDWGDLSQQMSIGVLKIVTISGSAQYWRAGAAFSNRICDIKLYIRWHMNRNWTQFDSTPAHVKKKKVCQQDQTQDWVLPVWSLLSYLHRFPPVYPPTIQTHAIPFVTPKCDCECHYLFFSVSYPNSCTFWKCIFKDINNNFQ